MTPPSQKKKALFPGTFDPPSLGHLDIIQRATAICDKLYLGIAVNAGKMKPLFSVEERKALLNELLHGSHVEVVAFSGLVIDFVAQHQLDFIVKGLRTFSDVEYEFKMALANRKMSGTETVFFVADPVLSHVSSTLIREIGGLGHRLHGFVPDRIEEKVFQRLQVSERRKNSP